MLCTLTVNQFPRLTLDMKIQRTVSGKEMSNIPLNPQRTRNNGLNPIILWSPRHIKSSIKTLNTLSNKEVNTYSLDITVLSKQSFAMKAKKIQNLFT